MLKQTRRPVICEAKLTWIVVPIIGLLGGAGCILSENRCDANQTHVQGKEADYCGCDPGSVTDPKGYGCVKCGVNEEVTDGQCTCQKNFAKLTPTSACEPVMGTPIGTACTEDGSCSGTFAHCLADGTERYCTRLGCSVNDCPTGFSCETAGGTTHCAKLPTGIGVSCASDTDCASFEAKSCDVLNRKCVLIGCKTGAPACPSGWGCCDLSMLGPSAPSICFAPEEISNGMCPVGKLVVP